MKDTMYDRAKASDATLASGIKSGADYIRSACTTSLAKRTKMCFCKLRFSCHSGTLSGTVTPSRGIAAASEPKVCRSTRLICDQVLLSAAARS